MALRASVVLASKADRVSANQSAPRWLEPNISGCTSRNEILDSGRGGALKPKDGLGITGSFQNHRRKHGQRSRGFGGEETVGRTRSCGTVSTALKSSVGGACSTVGPRRARSGRIGGLGLVGQWRPASLGSIGG